MGSSPWHFLCFYLRHLHRNNWRIKSNQCRLLSFPKVLYYLFIRILCHAVAYSNNLIRTVENKPGIVVSFFVLCQLFLFIPNSRIHLIFFLLSGHPVGVLPSKLDIHHMFGSLTFEAIYDHILNPKKKTAGKY